MTQRYIVPRDLLRLAAELAGKGAGPGKPRTIRLRKSISASYYAVFHELTYRAVLQARGVTWDQWSEEDAKVARWIAHDDLRQLAAAATGSGNQALKSALLPLDSRVLTISTNFLDLQDARHSADYDDFYDVSKALAVSYVDMAVEAVGQSRKLFSADEPTYRRYLAFAVGAMKVAKKR